ncbi:MAG: segregation/condensation protein A [Phycisphaerae bacterium]|nr:segregation/condensation protein A [Phycisphaerae bacterium]
MADDYRVQLDVYNGPLDLLLYLIRREEVDIYDIPIVRITEQYVGYVELFHEIDPNAAGEFLVLASMLMEIKSRMLLPKPPPESQEEFEDPRLELVRQLLEYKKFKDAADHLRASAEDWAQRYVRRPVEIDPEAEEQIDIDSVHLWDLVEAFREVMAKIGRFAPHEVQYDDTPLALHATDVVDRLQREGGSMEFISIFEGRTRSECIGLFLALLELVRQHRVRVEQEAPFAPIIMHLQDATPIDEPIETPSPFASGEEGSAADRTESDGSGSESSRGSRSEGGGEAPFGRAAARAETGEAESSSTEGWLDEEESEEDFSDMPEVPELADLHQGRSDQPRDDIVAEPHNAHLLDEPRAAEPETDSADKADGL